MEQPPPARFAQINASTDWVRPTDLYLSDNYVVRATDNNANLDVASSATGSWLAINGGETYYWWVTQNGIGQTNFSVTLEISSDGGSTIIDSGTYTGYAQIV